MKRGWERAYCLQRGLPVIAAGLLGACYTGAAPADGDTDTSAQEAPETSGLDADESTSSGLGSSTGGDESEILVPRDVPVVDVARDCAAVEADEHIVAVGPNGTAWLARSGSRTSRSLSPNLEFTALELDGSLEAAVVFGPTSGIALTEAGLALLDGVDARAIAWPDSLPHPDGLCGDPSVEGDAYVFAGDVHSRDAGQWWRWNTPAAPLDADVAVGATASACTGSSGEAFLLRRGDVWGVRADFLRKLGDFGPATSIASDDAFGLVSVVDDSLRLGDTFDAPSRVLFETGDPLEVEATVGGFFVLTPQHVYAWRQGVFTEWRSEGSAIEGSSLHADAGGGLWVAHQDELCRYHPTDEITVTGVRPYQRRRVRDIDLLIGSAQPPRLWLDGDALDLFESSEGWTTSLSVEEDGWHELVVENDATARSIPFEVSGVTPATWKADIEPMVQQYCSGESCHGVGAQGGQPELSSYAAWVDRADVIAERVVASPSMPPAGSDDGTWGVEQIVTVAAWLQAGLPEE